MAAGVIRDSRQLPAAGWCFAYTIAQDKEHALSRCYSLDRFEQGDELDEEGVGNWTYKQ